MEQGSGCSLFKLIGDNISWVFENAIMPEYSLAFACVYYCRGAMTRQFQNKSDFSCVTHSLMFQKRPKVKKRIFRERKMNGRKN